MEDEYQKLKDRDINELAEAFREIFTEVLQASAEEIPFSGWVLSQAPISIIKPNPKDTAFAANNGVIYINPAFINAVAHEAEEKGYSPKDIYGLYGYIISHEMAHIILQHPWDLRKFINIQEHIPWEIKREIANISMDYIINTTFCNPIYRDSPHPILGIIDSKDEFKKTVMEMDQILNSRDMLKEIEDIDNLEDMTWEDIYYLITKHIKDVNELDGPSDPGEHHKNAKEFSASSTEGSSNQGNKKESAESSSQNSSENHEEAQEAVGSSSYKNTNQPGSKKTVWTAHGEEKEIEEEASVRDGFLERCKNSKETAEEERQSLTDKLKDIRQAAEQIKEEFIHKMREAGFEKGGFYRSFVDSLKADTAPLQAKIKSVLSGVIQGQLRVSAWDRLSRRMPYITPGARTFPKPSAWFLMDVSGSVSEDEISAVMSSIRDLLESRTLGRAVIVTFDVGETGIFEARTAKDLKDIKISGGGGTELSPAIEKIERSLKWGDIAVVATDSEVADKPEELKNKIKDIVRITSHPVIWLHFGREKALNEIIEHSRNNIIPMIIEPERGRVTIKNYKKGVRV